MCSPDLPGATATPNRDDRVLYPLAARVPWLVRPVFTKLARDANRNPAALLAMLDRLGPADQEILRDAEFRAALGRSVSEAFRQGGRGVAQDYTLEARPWGLRLDQVTVPIDIWHGEDDRLVSADASRILAKPIQPTTTHFIPDAGHLILSSHALQILQTAISPASTNR